MWDNSDLIEIKTSLRNINFNLSKMAPDEEVQSATLEDTKSHIRFIRNACSRGTGIQNFIIEQLETTDFLQFLKSERTCDASIIDLSWQFVANLTVQNEMSQKFVWNQLGEHLFNDIRTKPIDSNTDKKLMIIYNICNGGLHACNEKVCLSLMADLWRRIVTEKITEKLVFVDLFFEYFLVKNQWTLRSYASLSTQNRIDVLDYIATYIRNESPNGAVRPGLMEFIAKEFRKKADCILKSPDQLENNLNPQEVYNLLSVISRATGTDMYTFVFDNDEYLFVSVAALLKRMVALGKDPTNQFAPMSRLEEVAPASRIDTTFESQVSFELKTLLIRTIGNLLYGNKENQQHCINMKLLPTLLECTTMDARNPLMKEWSILAIRNACFDCPEIQNLISQLTQTGVARNDLIDELNLEMGALRIQPRE